MSSEAYRNQRIEIKQAGLRNPLGLDTSLRSYSAGAIRKNHVMHPVVVGAGPVHGGHLASAQAATQETVIALSGARIRYSSLATADFNGDGSVVEPDGMASDTTSRQVSGGLLAPPVVDDVDNDGKLEILVGGGNTSGLIYIWNEYGATDSEPPWPMFRHNVLRNGRYPLPPRLGFPSELRFYHQEGSGATETLNATLRNLGEGEFDWHITNPIATLQVSPASGTVSTQTGVQFVLTTTGYPTDTWHNPGSLDVSGTVDGEHVQSSPLAVPVWLYVGEYLLNILG